MKHIALMATVLLGLVAAAHAQEGESRLSLDGTWAFTIDPAMLDKPDSDWDRLPVPGNWDVVNEYAHHVGKGWYRRTFAVPADFSGKRLRLRFEAVYESAEVSLNGRVVGSHAGGYTPFEIDVTDDLKPGENVVLVCADSTYRRGAWWAWGGISRPVSLVANNAVRLSRHHVRAHPDLESGDATVELDYTLTNDARSEQPVTLQTTIEGPTGAVASGSLEATIPAGGESSARMSLSIPVGKVKLWDPDHPHLFRATTRVLAGGAVQHSKSDRFGIRTISVTKDGLFLNGRQIRVNGLNRVHDHRAYGNTEPDHLVKLDIDLIKRLGGTMMRIMHAPQSPALLDYADEKGLLLLCEIPVWGDGDGNVVEGNPLTKQWLGEMIERDYNHPSIIGWSVGNELLHHFGYGTSMMEFVRKSCDSHRLVTYASFSGARKEYTPANDPISAADILLHNSYERTPGKTVESLRKKWPDLPIFLSEFGATQFGESLDSVIPGLETRWKSLENHPYVIGTSLWTFNDYRSNYEGSAPGELRTWGVVNLWRQEKAACGQIAKLYSPIRSLGVSDGSIRLEPRTWDETPSFVLEGYRLRWEWMRRDGTVAGGGLIQIPTITPGDSPLARDIDSAPGDSDNLIVSLISPTGYVVHEWQRTPPQPPRSEPKVTATSAPIIYKAYPVDGGFMLGYSTQKEDKRFTVEYGTESGKYTQTLSVAMPGAMLIRGLANGTTYYARLRRDDSDWSAEVSVTPDGGIRPVPPRVLGVVRGPGMAAIRFVPVEKATGYRIRYGDRVTELNCAAAGVAVIEGLQDSKDYSFTMTAISDGGESAPSDAVRSSPLKARAESFPPSPW
jgi:beta-galactosidase